MASRISPASTISGHRRELAEPPDVVPRDAVESTDEAHPLGVAPGAAAVPRRR